jgi:hypothetical protein
LFSPVNRREVIVGSLMFGTMLIGLWAIFSWMPTWIQSLIDTDAPKATRPEYDVFRNGRLNRGLPFGLAGKPDGPAQIYAALLCGLHRLSFIIQNQQHIFG